MRRKPPASPLPPSPRLVLPAPRTRLPRPAPALHWLAAAASLAIACAPTPRPPTAPVAPAPHVAAKPPDRAPPPVALTASAAHTCLLDRASGAVWCWGGNDDTQLGIGPGESAIPTPTRVTAVDRAVAIAAACYDTCAVRPDGAVRCWGVDGYLLGHPVGEPRGAIADLDALRDVVELSAGTVHVCARTRAGAVWCWGANDGRQSGLADEKPVMRPNAIALDRRAVAVAAGWSHSCALLEGGAAACWGEAFYGQLGGGDGFNAEKPVRVAGLTDAVALAAGRRHTCAVRAGGEVLCWGDNESCALGSRDLPQRARRPVAVPGIAGATAIAANAEYTCARLATGRVTCWGDTADGQRGDGQPTSVPVGTCRPPTQVVDLDDAVAIAAGARHACALRATGAVVCWGNNDTGQLGDGTRRASTRPVAVRLPR